MSEAERSAGQPYNDVVRRIEALNRSQVSIGALGKAFGYEILCLKVGQSRIVSNCFLRVVLILLLP